MAGPDVLSQSEIDDLLSALSTGVVTAEEIKTEEKQRKIKIYDFKRPDKFSKDQIRTIYMLHENFARMINTYLSAHLRTLIHIDVASVDQLTYEEFIRSMPNPSVISIFQMRPLKGNAILEINPNIVLAIIDRLFGGPGLPPAKARALTDIEEAIIRKVIHKAMESMQEAWKQVVSIEPRMEALETNPQFTQIVPPNDMVVLITLQAKIGQAEGLMNICIPYLVLEPIMSKLTTTFWVSSSTAKQSSPETMNTLQRKLEKTLIPVITELGRATISVHELLNLGVGDVLQLDTKAENDLSVIIGSREKFKCKPGLVGHKNAIQITQVISQGDDNDE
ncbi:MULTISPECIES: flagellar motor switch protein FliM [Sporomusa]|uniref:Flagellar motor switch protein FliM n=2 Tax=Sporomusa TaxID=2375 RepID=A0ABP2C1F0_9FIRM|nr:MULTISPECIES: flagellar motor switch protein FliM [Sporomusa]MCM0760185.1 flagellar motor switch protein FliM [Sporomusa sphaeroides DSM 2875]OLS58166.1 flagellar motor switch protein FliM [Sporomusa sphaeroides DSM 2875]CVK17647.1 Flagellar motor switch protein FliM [Sporomusa sphaeroides DSM 2875]SCM80454.1 Flagellar motor switch protein FliM [uncultured Sporomusa sp.]HML31499.1 flagellar motor switch protein FliM [Sporomusa sphaeroides]